MRSIVISLFFAFTFITLSFLDSPSAISAYIQPPQSVARGGTGATTLTANNVLLGNGTSSPQFVAPGTSGNVLTSNGTTWSSQAPSGGSVTHSKIILDSFGGNATTNTSVIFFINNTITNNGNNDFTYTSSSSNGDRITINNAGVYAMSFTNVGSISEKDITLNSTQLSTNVASITNGTMICGTTVSSAGSPDSCAITLSLAVNDVIRVQTDGVTATANKRFFFTMTRVL